MAEHLRDKITRLDAQQSAFHENMDEKMDRVFDKLDKISEDMGSVRVHSESLRWLEWGFRTLVAAVIGLSVYIHKAIAALNIHG